MVQYSIRLTFVYMQYSMFIRQKTDINCIHCDWLSFSAQIQIYYWNIVIQLTLDSARARTLQFNPNYRVLGMCQPFQTQPCSPNNPRQTQP